MAKFNVGDRVQATESRWDERRKESVPIIVRGTVLYVNDARTVYPEKPIYGHAYAKSGKGIKDYKHGEGEQICTVQVDGETKPNGEPLAARNFHEGQLSAEQP